MTARPTITIGIMPGTKLLRIERVPAHLHSIRWGVKSATVQSDGAWMLWVAANVDMTAGTHILLHDDGAVARVTVYNDGTEDVFVIKEGDE